MKAYLSLMGSLWSEKKQIAPISIGIYKPAIITFLILLCFVFAVKAQEIDVHSTPVAKAITKSFAPVPLQTGDEVPEGLWHRPLQVLDYPDGKKTVTLNDYRGKLIILDFWATWCKSCVESFPKLERLNEEFGNEIEIILVNSIGQTKDSLNKIQKTVKWYEGRMQRKVKLTSVVLDSVLASTFPHRALPHQVWIKDNKLFANTYSNEMNASNIRSSLQNDLANFHQKDDFKLNFQQVSEEDTSLVLSSVWTGYQEGAGNVPEKKSEGGMFSEYRIVNYPLYHFFQLAYLNDGINEIPTQHWFFEEGISRSLANKIKYSRDYTNQYSYTLRGLKNLLKDPRNNLREELAKIFGVLVSVGRKKSDVYVLRLDEKIDKIYSKVSTQLEEIDGEEAPLWFRNVEIKSFLWYVSKVFSTPVVYDGIHDESPITVTLPANFYEYDEGMALNYLRSIGFLSEVISKEIPIAIFRKKVKKERANLVMKGGEHE